MDALKKVFEQKAKEVSTSDARDAAKMLIKIVGNSSAGHFRDRGIP